MKVMAIHIISDAFEMVTKGLEKRHNEMKIRVRIETIQTTVLLKSDRILRGVLEI